MITDKIKWKRTLSI